MASEAASRVAVVTGASSGLGRDIAVAFGGRGHPVALVARSADGLATAADEIVAAGGEAVAIPTDVSDAGAVETDASARCSTRSVRRASSSTPPACSARSS